MLGDGLTRLQLLHLLVGAVILVLTMCFLMCFTVNAIRRRWREEKNKKAPYIVVIKEEDEEEEDEEQQVKYNHTASLIIVTQRHVRMNCNNQKCDDEKTEREVEKGLALFPVCRLRRRVLCGIMTVFFLCFNGTNFAFFTFLTELAVTHPNLQLTKSDGAAATTAYFISSALARMVSALFVSRLRSPAILVALDLLVLICGSVWMYHTVSPYNDAAMDPHTSLLIGCVLVGVGVSTLFSSGILWLIRQVGSLSGAVTSLFLVSTSMGAQLFKIPVPLWIAKHPVVVVHVVSFGAAACSVLFFAALVVSHLRTPRTNNNEKDIKRKAKLPDPEKTEPLIIN